MSSYDTVVPQPDPDDGVMTKVKVLAPVLAVCVLLLSGVVACSAGKPGASPRASAGSDHDQALKFAKCMRDHGVDMPDPGSDGSVTGVGTGADAPGSVGGSAPAVAISIGDNGAWEACRAFEPNGGVPQKLSAAELAQEVKVARCMRAHGIDYPDPSADGSLPFVEGSGLPDKAAMQRLDAASRACDVGASPTPAK